MIKPIVDGMFAEKMLIGSAGGIALRFVPPLTVSEEEIDTMVEKLDKVMAKLA
jgi:4-aminobutyrate aminotransferase-like enzyme